MQFGVSTWLWTSPFTTGDISLFSKIRQMGFTHVEIPIEDVSLIDAKVVARALEDNDLKPIVCGAWGPTRDLTHEDPNVHQVCFEYIYRCFDICLLWECEFLCGPMYSAVGKARLVPPAQRQREWQLAVENLRKVCEEAKTLDLKIALEPLNRFESDLVNTTSDVVRLIHDIDHPSAHILLDSFHMTIEERNLADAIRLAGDHLIHVQVSENYRGTPGTGQTNWADIRDGLSSINYQGVISIESFTPHVQELAGAVCIWKPFAPSQDDFAQKGLTFLQQLFK